MSRKKNNRNNNQEQKQQLQQPKLTFTNILGEKEEEPVCDFLNCYHKFSLHGHRSHQAELNCICNHPTNAALGIVVVVVKK
jgi:hypothetical protein